MHAFLNKDAYAIAPPPPVCPATTVSRSYLDFSTKLASPFSATLVQNNGPYFPAPKYFFNITFKVFFQNFPPRCTVTGSGTNIWWTFYNTAREKGKRCVCVSETSGNVHACVSETHVSCFRVRNSANNRLLNVAGVQRFLRYAYTARFRVIQTRKTLHVLYVHIRKQYLAYFLYTETVMCMCV